MTRPTLLTVTKSHLPIRNAIYGIQNKLKSKQELVVRAVRSGLLDE